MLESIKGCRVFFKSRDQTFFLKRVRKLLKINNAGIAGILGLSRRTVDDWQREKYSMPLKAVEVLCAKSNLNIPKNIQVKDRFWYTHGGGNAGGIAVYNKYGHIGGNPEYRKRRWREWWENKGRHNKHSITAALPVRTPPQSEALAEFVGIILGDGGISERQVTVTLHKVDDIKYADYVKKLIFELFNVTPSFYFSKKDNVIDVVVSRSELVKYLINLGLCVGSKVRHQIDVPLWIKNSNNLSRACIRGLFDTDGCLYIDKHKVKDKIYSNCGMNFTNRSLPLLDFFKSKLEYFGYHPTQKTKFSIFLRREDEIIKYFQTIGFGNYKYKNKLEEFLKNKYGEVPKWS